jgi:hypothetical protein
MEQFTRGSCSNQHQHYPHTHTIIQWSTFSGDLLAKSKMPTSQRYIWICSQRGFEESSYTLFGSGNLFDKFKQHVWNNVAYWTLHEGIFPSLEPAELRLSGFEAKVRKVSCRDLGLAWVKMMIRELWWLCWMASWSDKPLAQIQHGHQWSTMIIES